MRALHSLGALTLDCDEIYHGLLITDTDMKAELQARFKDVLTNGVIDRMKLGKIVFNDPAALRELNTITHRYVSAEIDKRIVEWETQGGTITALDAIALIESGQGKNCNVIVGVTSPPDIRTARIMKRDDITEEHAQMRINAQQPDEFYKKYCDHLLENIHNTPAEFEEICIEFFKSLLQQ